MADSPTRFSRAARTLLPVLLVISCIDPALAQDAEGLAFAPFGAKNRDAVEISHPGAFLLGHEPPPAAFNHFVSFSKHEEELSLETPIPLHGQKGERFSLTLRGGIRLGSGGRAELGLFRGDERVGWRIFKKDKYIYFNVDDRFKVAGPVQIKVEINDEANCRWRIEYTSPDATLNSTRWVQTKNDGRVRTVTFRIDDIKFANAQPSGMDFRIACDGPEDVTVQWVRVMRDNVPE